MIGGWKATRVVGVSIEFVRTIGEEVAQRYVSEGSAGDWFIRGPRGGRYIADAGQVTVWRLDKEAFFDFAQWRFLGHRKELRYVRPGSRDAARFDALGH
jgi:hypothetical protein